MWRHPPIIELPWLVLATLPVPYDFVVIIDVYEVAITEVRSARLERFDYRAKNI